MQQDKKGRKSWIRNKRKIIFPAGLSKAEFISRNRQQFRSDLLTTREFSPKFISSNMLKRSISMKRNWGILLFLKHVLWCSLLKPCFRQSLKRRTGWLPAVHNDRPSAWWFQSVLFHIQHELQQRLGAVGGFVVWPGCVPVVLHTAGLTPLLKITQRF